MFDANPIAADMNGDGYVDVVTIERPQFFVTNKGGISNLASIFIYKNVNACGKPVTLQTSGGGFLSSAIPVAENLDGIYQRSAIVVIDVDGKRSAFEFQVSAATRVVQ